MMDTAAVALIIEQNRQTHRRLDDLQAEFRAHVEKDEAVHALVLKHDAAYSTTVKVAKWTGTTAIATFLAWLGFK